VSYLARLKTLFSFVKVCNNDCVEWKTRIVSDPLVLMGKPIVKGTRLGVGFLLDIFAQGWTKQQVLENYPQLSEEDLKAIFAYSAARIGNEDLIQPIQPNPLR